MGRKGRVGVSHLQTPGRLQATRETSPTQNVGI